MRDIWKKVYGWVRSPSFEKVSGIASIFGLIVALISLPLFYRSCFSALRKTTPFFPTPVCCTYSLPDTPEQTMLDFCTAVRMGEKAKAFALLDPLYQREAYQGDARKFWYDFQAFSGENGLCQMQGCQGSICDVRFFSSLQRSCLGEFAFVHTARYFWRIRGWKVLGDTCR